MTEPTTSPGGPEASHSTDALDRRMRRVRLSMRLISIAFVVIGLACAVVSLPNGFRELARTTSQADWIRVDGSVIGYLARPEELPFRGEVRVERPMVEYRVMGVTRVYVHPRATPLDFPLGASVALRYDPAVPERVTYERSVGSWVAPMALGSVPLLLGIVVGAVMWIRSGDATWLRTATAAGAGPDGDRKDEGR